MKTLVIIAAMAFSTIAYGQGEWVETKYNTLTAQIEYEGDSIIITERKTIATPQEAFHLVIVIKDSTISFYDSKRHLPYTSARTEELANDFKSFLRKR